MNRPRPLSVRIAALKIAAALWLLTASTGQTMTWYFGYDPPADKRAPIENAMNEAVATYNANYFYDVAVRVVYNSGVPTAQASYNGELAFGGSISARVATHEISHYLGTGTTNEWYGQFDGGGAWIGAATSRYMKLFDGPGGLLRQSGQHYYPYGLNYDNEDSPQNRIREVKLVGAMRFDMGGRDSNGNGIPDEWELFKVGNLSMTRIGDIDGDGISNYDEWWTEGDPLRACPVKEGHTYLIRARQSQKLVEVAGNSKDNGTAIDQYTANGTLGQRWIANYRGGGYWRFINVNSGKVMETAGVRTDATAPIQQWEWLNNDGQQWRIVPGDSALYFKVFNKAATNMNLDVLNGSTADAARLIQYNDLLNVPNQEFAFDDVTDGEPAVNLVAEYKLDGTVRDNSGRNWHGVGTGGITYTAGRVDGTAATFNGANASVEIPATVDANFSISLWVRTTATGGTPQWYNGLGLVDAEVGGVAADFGLGLVGSQIGFGVGNPDYTLLSSATVNDGNWHHVAATRNNNTGAMQIYIDGVLSASGTGAIGGRFAPARLRLGSIAGSRNYFNGSLDEVRLYNGILSRTEITRLAGVGMSGVALYNFEGNALDGSGHNNHGNPVGVTYVPGKVGGSAAQFDGTGSFVQIPASVDGDFSVAFWTQTTAVGGTGQWYAGKSIVDADVPGAANDWGIALVGDRAAFGVGNSGAGTTIQSTTPINNGAWQHVVATRVNSTGAMRLYVNGVLQASGTGATGYRDTPGGIRVGSTLYGGSFFNGAVDDLRIYNYALTTQQVTSLLSPVPAPWTSADVGNPGGDGFSGYTVTGGGTYTVTGGGADIGTMSDQFQFVSAPLSGDQTVFVRVPSIPVTPNGAAASAKAGLMFRDSTAANSAFAAVIYDGNVGVRFLSRDTTGVNAFGSGNSVPLNAPFWLRLTRAGNTFTAFYATTTGTPSSTDWVLLASNNTAMNVNALVGLAVSSRNTAQVATATFTNFTTYVPSPANSWRLDYFGTVVNAGESSDAADPDGDGISNLMERALGLNPKTSNPGSDLPQYSSDGNVLSLSYNRSRAATDLQYQMYWSTDLINWSAANVSDTVTSSTATLEMHRATVPLSTINAPRGFLRLQVTP